MARPKMIYISEAAHQRLKMLSARKRVSMGKMVETWIDAELSDLANPWTTPDGLALQERALTELWEDSALDAYEDD